MRAVPRGWAFPTLLLAALVALVAACGGAAPSQAPGGATPVATPGAKDIVPSPAASAGPQSAISCSLLTPADFTAAGIAGAGVPSDSPDGSGGHYCVYAGKSGATGGIELDVFPGADLATARDTYATAAGEGPEGSPPAGSNFSEASYAVDGAVAYLTARQGRLVVSLSAPNSPTAESALVSLAKMVAQRAGDAAGG